MLATLVPSQLQDMDFHIHVESEISELHDGSWTIVSRNATPTSLPITETARIYDSTSLSSTKCDAGVSLQVSAISEKRYWRLPIEISPILTRLLHSVSNLGGNNTMTKELRLAIRLHGLLSVRSVDQDSDSESSNGGGNPGPSVGRNRGPRARKRRRFM